jgi:CheY-like chemotaxis protein
MNVYRILAVDDDPTILKLVDVACRPFDLRTLLTTVSSVHGAADAVRSTKYDMLLLDHDIAGVRGWELLDYVKANLKPGVTLLVYSGGMSPQDVQKYRERNVVEILNKPLSIDALGFAIRRALKI